MSNLILRAKIFSRLCLKIIWIVNIYYFDQKLFMFEPIFYFYEQFFIPKTTRNRLWVANIRHKSLSTEFWKIIFLGFFCIAWRIKKIISNLRKIRELLIRKTNWRNRFHRPMLAQPMLDYFFMVHVSGKEQTLSTSVRSSKLEQILGPFFWNKNIALCTIVGLSGLPHIQGYFSRKTNSLDPNCWLFKASI